MTVSRVDPEARSTHAAAEGHRALILGDTVLARQKYTEAGEILERASKKELPATDKHLLRFLAASQYYHGGDYKKAAALTARINPGHLRPGHRPTLEQFRKDVEERADAGYADRIRRAVIACWLQDQAEEGIRLLQDHPYVFDRAWLAWLRAELCYGLRRWHPTALFYADAIRFSASHPTHVFLRAASVIHLALESQHADARALADFHLASEPTALDLVAGCAARLGQLLGGDLAVGEDISRLFSRAVEAFPALPHVTQSDKDVRSFMAHGYALAAVAADRLGDRTEALKLAGRGLAFDPNGLHAADFRTILADPTKWFGRPAEQIAAIPASLVASMLEREANQESALRSAA